MRRTKIPAVYSTARGLVAVAPPDAGLVVWLFSMVVLLSGCRADPVSRRRQCADRASCFEDDTLFNVRSSSIGIFSIGSVPLSALTLPVCPPILFFDHPQSQRPKSVPDRGRMRRLHLPAGLPDACGRPAGRLASSLGLRRPHARLRGRRVGGWEVHMAHWEARVVPGTVRRPPGRARRRSSERSMAGHLRPRIDDVGHRMLAENEWIATSATATSKRRHPARPCAGDLRRDMSGGDMSEETPDVAGAVDDAAPSDGGAP